MAVVCFGLALLSSAAYTEVRFKVVWSSCKAVPLINSDSPCWEFTNQCFLPWPLSTKHEDFISQPTMISLAISLSLVSELSATSSVVFRPSRDVPSLLQIGPCGVKFY